MENKNYHDLVDRNEITDSVVYWNGKGKLSFISHEFIGKTIDEAIAYWMLQAKKTEDLDKALWAFAENADLLATDADLIILNALLNHPERDRLRLIHDGSYYTHRIWFHVDNNGHITVTPSICWKDSEFKRMSNQMSEMAPHEQIDFLFKNFEVVYVQTNVVEDREAIKRWILDEKWNREADSFNWDYLD